MWAGVSAAKAPLGANYPKSITRKPSPTIESGDSKQKKKPRYSFEYQGFRLVGMTRFELATTRPPDVYSNRAELHPELV